MFGWHENRCDCCSDDSDRRRLHVFVLTGFCLYGSQWGRMLFTVNSWRNSLMTWSILVGKVCWWFCVMSLFQLIDFRRPLNLNRTIPNPQHLISGLVAVFWVTYSHAPTMSSSASVVNTSSGYNVTDLEALLTFNHIFANKCEIHRAWGHHHHRMALQSLPYVI